MQRSTPQFWSSVNVATMQSIALALLPDGGQRVARRNAWSASAADARVLRARREATVVLAEAERRAAARSAAMPSSRGALGLHVPAAR